MTVKNRSRVIADGAELRLFPNCVTSIVSSIPAGIECELVVADWQSDDWPLAEWLERAANPIPVTVLTLSGAFSRGAGRNAAARAAKGDLLFFLDADCLICEQLVREGLAALANKQAYFPVVYSFNDREHTYGWWRHRGFGNAMVSREAFETAGGFPEYGFWGREDVEFFESVRRIQDVVRQEVAGFYHQWHPNDFSWKNHYGQPSPIEELNEAERRQTSAAVQEIVETIPANGALILVDDALLDGRLPDHVRVFPFLEREGEYWGLPADSVFAISELERMRRDGAEYIAFAWPAFWWFEHYTDFGAHLRARYPRIVDNEQLVIFDLRRSIAPASARQMRESVR
jgi:glycosyltransferase involved in cell wall biosynthesis